MSEEVWEVWGAYHERERLCPEGVRVREIAHVHYACESHAGWMAPRGAYGIDATNVGPQG